MSSPIADIQSPLPVPHTPAIAHLPISNGNATGDAEQLHEAAPDTPEAEALARQSAAKLAAQKSKSNRKRTRPTIEESFHDLKSATEGPLPIVLGVSGHRDLRLEDIDTLKKLVLQVFTEFKAEYPNTPLMILTALAEGADRLVAEVALEAGYRLISVLPLGKEEYEKDFETAESREEFNYLLDRSEHWFELPIVVGATEESVQEQGHDRNMQYAQVGAYLASHCQVLVALWDGVIRDAVGGTSQVVKYKLEGIPEPFAPRRSVLDAVESGPVYHVITPRQSNPQTKGTPLTLHKRFPQQYGTKLAAEHAFEDIYQRMELFNTDALALSEPLAADRKQSASYVFPNEKRNLLSKSLQATLDFYAIADSLSIYYQKHFFKALKTMLMIVFSAAVFFNIFTFIATEDKLYLIVYLMIFILALGWHTFAARKGYQNKYLDYRALAEGLRIQFFWELGGLTDSVADFYLRKQKSELDWIRHGIRVCLTPRGLDMELLHKLPVSHQRERLEMVLNHWVIDQAKYFTKSAKRDAKKMEQQEKRVQSIFLLGLGISITQLIVPPSAHLMMFASIAPVGAALVHSYTEKKALSEHSKQYERMSILFTRAKQHLESLLEHNRMHEANTFLVELGKEALIENGDWIMTHRERPLDVPKG